MTYAFFSRLLPLVAVTAFSLTALPASASIYDSLVVFGDSLSDNGNNASVIGSNAGQTITGNTYVPSQPYGSGAYSNGPVWASDAAAKLGVPLQPSLPGGTDYAFGGATTGPAGSGFPYSLLTQASQYLTTHSVSANALYVIAGGGNDARAALGQIAACAGLCAGPTVATTATQYATNVGAIVDALQASGAKHIVVWNTPNLGLAPAVAGPLGFVEQGQGFVLKRLGLLEQRETVARLLLEVIRMLVVPAVRAADGELVVLPLGTEDVALPLAERQ